MSREHLKCFLPLPTGHIVGKMHMSSKFTQHVITGFQVPSPPVIGCWYSSRWSIREMVRDELVLKTRSLGPPRTLRLSTMSGVIRGMLKKSLEVGKEKRTWSC